MPLDGSPLCGIRGVRGRRVGIIYYLRSIGERVAADGMSVTSVVRSGKPAAEIADIAYTQSAAAIVMATHGRTGFLRTMRGSVAGADESSPHIPSLPGSNPLPPRSQQT